ncbi:MAG: hypothetical protein ACLFQ8_01990 [Candidatus Aenigmatarchaeota archaeon]
MADSKPGRHEVYLQNGMDSEVLSFVGGSKEHKKEDLTEENRYEDKKLL